MSKKNYLLLQNNYMAHYTLYDVEYLDNVVIYHRKRVSNSWLINILYNIHNSGKLQQFVELPLKKIWDGFLFNKLLKDFTPDYIIFTTSWYSDHLLSYFRHNCKNSKILLRFSDMVSRELGGDKKFNIEKIRDQFDGVLVYSQEDADVYGFTYLPVGYSAISKSMVMPCKQYDVVFIGAEKGRMDKIRQAYNTFVTAGLSCFFYVTMVKEQDRKDDGIIYANQAMSFLEYLSYEINSKCLFEIVQEGSSGRTYRMMESIIYNKLLITNCREIKSTNYYCPNYVQLYDDVSQINPSFVINSSDKVNYHYQGDFSPVRVLEYIEKNWQW